MSYPMFLIETKKDLDLFSEGDQNWFMNRVTIYLVSLLLNAIERDAHDRTNKFLNKCNALHKLYPGLRKKVLNSVPFHFLQSKNNEGP